MSTTAATSSSRTHLRRQRERRPHGQRGQQHVRDALDHPDRRRPGLDAVELGNDNIAGSVTVSVGNANGDSITREYPNDSVSGRPRSCEGNGGPADGSSLGNTDTISVAQRQLQEPDSIQLLNGTDDSIRSAPGIIVSPINPTTSTVVDGVSILPRVCTTIAGQRRWRRDHDHRGLDLPLLCRPVNLPLPRLWPVQHHRRSGQRERGARLFLPTAA